MSINPATTLTLVSHHLCPYVQRAAISLAEKGVTFQRVHVDLANKPGWFEALSPLGKVPLLRVVQDGKETIIFESAVILEYLEESQPNALHPSGPLERARHRSWIEFGSSILNRIGAFYNAKSDADLTSQAQELSAMFARVESELTQGPWFSGQHFSLVDAVYGPIFRYFDVFDQIDDFGAFDGLSRTLAWRKALAGRASVRGAVAADYPERLLDFLSNRKSAIGARVSPLPQSAR